MPNPRLFDRAVIHVFANDDKEDVNAFLQGLVTNDIDRQYGAKWCGLLTPQGKALFDFFTFYDTSGVFIDCERQQADALIRRLSMYRLRRNISIVKDDRVGVFWDPKGLSECKDPRLSNLGSRWIGTPSGDDEDVSVDYHAHRLLLGVTEGVAELGSDQTLWLEANAAELNGVSFSKGCYVGQENTARMNWRQKVNRRLVVVPLADADPKRQRIAYPELGLSVEHRRVEDMADLALPEWQRTAIT